MISTAPLLELEGVSKRFRLRRNRADTLKSRLVGLWHHRWREEREELWALRDVSMTLHRGETVGILGRNGSGKSTLLEIMAGLLIPTGGSVVRAPDLRIGPMLQLGIGFHPDLTGRENLRLSASLHGFTQAETSDRIPGILAFAGLTDFDDVPLKAYSTGMQMRLGFALATSIEPDLLLVDEVLAVGDEGFQSRCFETIARLRARGATIVVVSHAPLLLQALCDRVAILEGGRLLDIAPPREAAARYHSLCADPASHSRGPQILGVVRTPSISKGVVAFRLSYDSGDARALVAVSILEESKGNVEGGNLLPILGRGTVDWEVETHGLAPGRYVLHVVVYDAGARVLCNAGEPVVFVVNEAEAGSSPSETPGLMTRWRRPSNQTDVVPEAGVD